MNLGKLLAAGKGFLGGRNSLAYRENKNVYLPKFKSVRNPFEAKAEEKKSAVAPVPPKTVVPAVVPAVAPVAAKKRQAPVFAAQKPLATASWAERLNPFRAPAPAPAAQMVTLPVQTELSLNAVKVLHNDLSDADVEVVPAKSRNNAPVESPRLLPTRGSLEFFGERQLETA